MHLVGYLEAFRNKYYNQNATLNDEGHSTPFETVPQQPFFDTTQPQVQPLPPGYQVQVPTPNQQGRAKWVMAALVIVGIFAAAAALVVAAKVRPGLFGSADTARKVMFGGIAGMAGPVVIAGVAILVLFIRHACNKASFQTIE